MYHSFYGHSLLSFHFKPESSNGLLCFFGVLSLKMYFGLNWLEFNTNRFPQHMGRIIVR